jgi:pimeloyl-ACP methyl ester carboxylesterase
MSLILGSRLARQGYEVVAPDLPGYGMTEVGSGPVTYSDWVELVVDLLARERARGDQPIAIFGLSAGGLMALHVAAIDEEIVGVISTCLLDQRIEQVRLETAFSPTLARIATPLVQFLARTPLRYLKIPMRLVSKMQTLVNDPGALPTLLGDPTSAGAWVSLAFLDSYVGYQPILEASEFRICPVLLTQPGADRWTPIEVSRPVLDTLPEVEICELEGAGHLPLKDPGLLQLEEAVQRFLGKVFD